MSDGDPPEIGALREQAHDQAERSGHDGYLDPHTGLFVMTRSYLLRRGTCCSSGCRHCPYGSHPAGAGDD